MGSQSYWENAAQVAQTALSKIDVASNQVEANRLNAIKVNALQQAELIKRATDAPVGTIKYYEGLITDAQKALADLPEGADPALVATQQYIITEARAKADQIQKRNATKTFAEELDEKKVQYESYQRYLTAYGQETADAQFVDLRQSGASYVDYLNGEISKLEAKRGSGTLSEKDLLNLNNLTGRRAEETGEKTPIELFTESLDRAKTEAASLTDYLDILKAKQAQLGPTDYGKKRIVSERIVATTYERDDNVKQYLQSVVDSEEQITAIRKKYVDLRAGLGEQAAAGMARDYAGQLARMGKDEQKELDEAKLRRLQDSKEWETLTAKIVSEGRKGQGERIDQLRAKLELLKNDKLQATQEYKEALLELEALEKERSKNPLEDFKVFAGLAGELGQALSGVNGGLGDTGQLLSGIASQANLLASAFKDGIEPQEQIANALQGAIGLVNILTSSANERRAAEEAYYQSVNAFQQQKNLLLNDEGVIKAKNEQNVFGRDYDRELKANMAKYTDAQLKYRESMAKLNEGQVKIGQRDAVDWGKVGSGAASGAAIGASTPLGPVGALIGGVIGAIGGLFAGKKKEDVYGNLLQQYPELLQKSASGAMEVNRALASALLSSELLDPATKALVQNTLDWQKAIDDAQAAIKGIVGELAGSLGNKLMGSLVDAFKGGTEAAQQFSDDVGSILEGLVTQLLFSKTLGPYFDTLQKELSASLTTGDGNVIDDFKRFTENSQAAAAQYSKLLSDFQIAANDAGFKNVLTNPKDKKSPSLSGAIAGITEATSEILAGQMNAIRITQADTNGLVRRQLLHLSNIDRNTGSMDAKLDSLTMLNKIYDVLKANPLRGIGG